HLHAGMGRAAAHARPDGSFVARMRTHERTTHAPRPSRMTASELHLELPELPGELQSLRQDVRRFVAAERASGGLPYPDKVGLGFDPAVTRKIAAQGWIGMTWPREYGGHARSALERYVVTEELLAAGVPVGAHWISDRQSGPVLLKFGSEAQRR